MNYKLSLEQADNVLKILQENYRVYAPITFKGEGLYSYTDSIRYGEINSFKDVEYKIKSQGSPKEILLPINHSLSIESNGQTINTIQDIDNRNILILLRSCDIHGINRIDKAFMNDEFYRIRRDKVKFVVMECPKSWDTCFCVSLGTNTTDNYSLGIRFEEESISIKVKDEEFDKYFKSGYSQEDFELIFATENETQLNIPNIEVWDKETMDEVKKLDLWNEYKNRCIGCGSCNMACLTCTCLTKSKITYSDNANLTETRRVWSGCQLVKSSALKNKSMPEVVPARVRQRVLDKFYRPKLNSSNEQVCVGCGRCTDVCPRFINFSTTVNKLSKELDSIYTKLGRDK